MARTLNLSSHAVRRDAIVDATERLIRTSGYDQMSVQDVQDALGVSRGAIYHYFDSKAAMVEAVIERMTDALMAVVEPIVADPDMAAGAKLQAVFRAGGQWKTERKGLMLAIARAWYSSNNALVRERSWRAVNVRLVPLLAEVVRQGAAQAAFRAAYPDHAASILVALLESSSDAIGRLLMARLDGAAPFAEVERAIAAYNEAIERILGLPAGSFQIIDQPTLEFWFG